MAHPSEPAPSGAAAPALSEADVCDRFITPAIVRAGFAPEQIRREYTFTAGPVRVRRNVATRGAKKRADYVLFASPDVPLAVVEAKDASHGVSDGMQQALGYAAALDAPFAFSSNGSGFALHDRTGQSDPVERTLPLDAFPSPETLWAAYRRSRGFAPAVEPQVRFPYHDAGDGKRPRYYQHIAIQRAVEAVARGERRILLAMATGTGKTYVAFQLIWRLWKAGIVKRVLFLADRSILIDQTYTNDFKPFGGAMTRVKHRQVDKSYEVYLALYQGVSGPADEQNIYRQFSREFFDLVVIDECHRGSARDDSAWREILDYFAPAIQLGLTATPKETREVSTLSYFGRPVYTYSLKQGIADGFLAPYMVVRVDLDKDVLGWRPTRGETDDHGALIEDRTYNGRDMERTLVLTERAKRVAETVVAYLQGTDPYGKTIVFCQDIDHAERMRRELVNVIGRVMPAEKTNLQRFVVRITGDSDEGKRALDDFIHPEHRYPVIATTSKLLTTGVDAKTCKVIAIDQNIESLIEFKQIVGRGTRIHEETGKLWFTIVDFRKATELFADPDWDGEPVVVYTPADPAHPVPPDDDAPDETEPGDPGDPGEAPDGVKKYVVSGVPVGVLAERVQYYGRDGRLITESLKDYSRTTVQAHYRSLDDFLRRWSAAERKQAVLDELEEQGLLLHALQDELGADLDPFDIICHLVYDQPLLTRRQRAAAVRKRDVFTKYGAEARAVLDALLDKYADEGLEPAIDPKVLRVRPFSTLGTAVELVGRFGGADGYRDAVRELEAALYSVAA